VAIEAGQDCERCNYDNADLTGQRFDDFILNGSTFRGATLTMATFRRAKIRQCDLSNAAGSSATYHSGQSGRSAPFGRLGAGVRDFGRPCARGRNGARFRESHRQYQLCAYDLLTGPKTLVPFTAEEGADLHCEPMVPRLRDLQIFD
jgi:uncharacterized protein YjbI with pentapeptide repeats